MKKHLLIALPLMMAATGASAQMIAAGTDVAQDLLMTPNLGVEMVVGERTTLGLSVFGNHKPWGRDMKMIGLQPEYRYYFSGRPMHSFFVGAGAVAASYDITWKGKVYDGEAAGAGLTFGYVINLSRRLNIDCHAGFGAIFYKQKEYFTGDTYDNDYIEDGRLLTNAHGYVLLPTRIGVSITYILK